MSVHSEEAKSEAAPETPAGPHRPRRGPLLLGLALLVVVALALYFSYGRNGSPAIPAANPAANPAAGQPLPLPQQQQGAAAGSYSAVGITTVELDGFSGNITVTAAQTAQITDTVQNGKPLSQLDSATHTLRLFCAAGAGCPSGNYVVTIPEHVGLVLHQASGQTQLVGLSGPVDITASSANTMATGLTTPDFTAVITSGRLDASFSAAPAKISVSVVSAQATLHLPAAATYAVAQQVASGNVQVQVPQDPNSTHVIDAAVTSGQVTLVTTS
ncbi:MAG TPA: DUF4097 family beta strand repeat-containing protein [Actinocrinis sp.]|nr:DUF4097 family beta strand repeat-containing protein [Actinocrinis sp.]